MKNFLSLLFLALVLAAAQTAFAQAPKQVQLGIGQQKTVVAGDKFRIKFISVLEDSRCPRDVKCIWSGNAKIKVQVTMVGGPAKTFEFNTTTGGPLGGQLDSYSINLVSLTPHPNGNRKIRQRDYRATISVNRLTR